MSKIFVLLLFIMSCISCSNSPVGCFMERVKKNDKIAEVKVLDNEGDIFNEYYIDVILKNGKTFSLKKVNGNLSGRDISLYKLNGYLLDGGYKVKKKDGSFYENGCYFKFEFLERYLNIKLNTIDDFISNYELIEHLVIEINKDEKRFHGKWDIMPEKTYKGYYEDQKYIIEMFSWKIDEL